MFSGDVAPRYGLDDGGPDVGAEERGGNVGVMEVEDGRGEGGEGWRWGGRQVDYLGLASVRGLWWCEGGGGAKRTRRFVR